MAKIDTRSREDILNDFKERSESYTPEWNMDTNDPDIACALAMAYADMILGTIKNLNGIPLKNKIAFFNIADAQLLPAEPSKGFVRFSLASGDQADTFVPTGTVLAASDGDDAVRFETLDDINVSNALVEKIFCTDDSSDYICEYEDFRGGNILLFKKTQADLQSHSMTVEHPYLFDLRGEGEIKLSFFKRSGLPVTALSAFADKKAVLIEYYAGEEAGYVPFENIRCDEDGLLLQKSVKSPAFEQNENGCFAVRFTANDVSRFDNFSFVRVTAASSGTSLECNFASNGETEFPKAEFYPFGEQFRLFGETYFACREALGKRGAKITFSFDLRFDKIPSENWQPETEIEWKWVAKKSDLKQPREYDITISEVIWEYYNGNGWSRLFPDMSYSDIFTPTENVRECYRSMTFTCPEDIAKVFVGSEENFFIRAKIIKADNLFKITANYLSPRVRNLSFNYGYPKGGRTVNKIRSYNNLAEAEFDSSISKDGFVPFCRTGCKQTAVYLGFSAPPENGPYRIMWDIVENPLSPKGNFVWEYLTDNGWEPLNLIDNTENFSETGSTVFLNNRGFLKSRLFANELYWVRIVAADNSRNGALCIPNINGIFENSVRAVNLDSRVEEHFAMNIYTENAEFQLSDQNILELEMYVDETGSIGGAELSALENEGRVLRHLDSAGMTSRIQVKWLETYSFAAEDADARCYMLDKSSGKFIFGNGRHGKIPPASDVNNIQVLYTTGGGERSNVDAGLINRLERSVGFVTGVENPRQFIGGYDTETLDKAMQRYAVRTRTGGRAVTARDLEQLTLCAARNIRRVRCCAGYDQSGKREDGAVTLVVVKDNDADFSEVRNDILKYLTPRMADGIISAEKLYITEPEYVEVAVKASVSVKSVSDIYRVRGIIEDKLSAFLNVSDSGNDWEVGMLPSEQQIRSCILGSDNVVSINSLHITVRVPSPDGMIEIDAQQTVKRRFILPKSGTHDILITLI